MEKYLRGIQLGLGCAAICCTAALVYALGWQPTLMSTVLAFGAPVWILQLASQFVIPYLLKGGPNGVIFWLHFGPDYHIMYS